MSCWHIDVMLNITGNTLFHIWAGSCRSKVFALFVPLHRQFGVKEALDWSATYFLSCSAKHYAAGLAFSPHHPRIIPDNMGYPPE
jgi:hypothetical protein